MIENPMDVLNAFPVRKNKKQKQAFRDAVQSYGEGLGYAVNVEKGSFGAKNLLIGNPETAKYLVTAHYDTPARLPFPNLITPCNFWAFMAYQLFVVAFMFAMVGIVGAAVYLLTRDSFLGYWSGYMSVWIFLVLMMVGPANKHNANDNTSGVVTVLETAKSLPAELREQVCFVLFDLEEAGLIGSASYASAHKKQIKDQIILNCDCVGDGDELMLFPNKKTKQDALQMDALRSICGEGEGKSLALREKGFAYYPSDQKNFPSGVGIAAFRRSKWAGLYCGRIHTKKDTVLDEKNVSFLRDKLIQLIGSAAQ
ncbi:MAG: Zn-dependent exopeptidase M28 [Ruminococcaceae bacterium]|nr:Zn-dependent exopeptidase M28 [Oscillospiraceae bacterium]